MSFDDRAIAVLCFIHAWSGQSGSGFVPQLSGPVVVDVVVTTLPPLALAAAVVVLVGAALDAALALGAALVAGSALADALAAAVVGAEGAGAGAADVTVAGSFWASGLSHASSRETEMARRVRERNRIVRKSLVDLRETVPRDLLTRPGEMLRFSRLPWSARRSS
jgi:hypothetical protein